jgi:hypothetical protein
MISVTQGPSINASLASLDYDKKFEAGREGIRKVAEAQEAKNQEIKDAFKDMTDNFQKAQITGSKVAAAIENNPELFAGLEDSNSLTAKSYKKFLNGDYSPQVVNNLNAYIDSAQTQITNANAIQEQKDMQTAASALTDIIKLQFPEGMSDDDIDSVTQSDLTRTMLNYISTKDLTTGAQSLILAGIQKYGQNLSTTDEFAYDAKIESNMKAFDAFSDAYSKGDTAAAMRAISTSPLYSEYINVKDVTGEIIRQRSADEIAAILGISQPKPDAPEDDDEDYSDDSGIDAAVEALGEDDLNSESLTRYTNFKSKDLNDSIETAAEVDVAMDMKKTLKILLKELKQAEDKLADRGFRNVQGVDLDKSYYQNQITKKKSAILDIIEQLDKMLKVESNVANKSTAQLESEVFK